MNVESVKDVFDDFVKRLKIIADYVASGDLPNACVQLGIIMEKCQRISGHFENNEEDSQRKDEFLQAIKERKEILERLEKLGKLFNG